MTGKATAAPIRIGVLGAARIADLAIVTPARVTAHLRDGAPLPTRADDAVANMQLIDDCYRAAGLTPRPTSQPLITKQPIDPSRRPSPILPGAPTARKRSTHDHSR